MFPRLATTIVATGLALLACAPVSQAAFPGPNGQIVYQPGPEYSFNGLNTMSPDATGNRVIISTTARAPEWSPDGRRIAYNTSPSGIYIVAADGSGATNPVDGHQPAWSPDGARIAFVRSVDNFLRLFIANADGSGEAEVPGLPPGSHWSPDWSPDGSRIVFAHTPASAQRSDLYAVDPDGGNLLQLTSTSTLNEERPDWSPDGSKIAFVVRSDAIGGPEESIWRMNPDGAAAVQLAAGAASHPAWSPDGTKIAFRKPYGFAHIWLMNADGSNQVDLGVSGNSPDWQPNLWPGHARPKGATPVRVPLVPAYFSCGNANEQHGPPLSFPSCSPPLQESTTLTVGTPDANGFSADSVASARFETLAGDPGTPGDEADVALTLGVTGVRCRAANAACPGGAGSDYAGSLLMLASLRVTDKIGGAGGNESTTVSGALYLRAPASCTATADPATGSDCTASTTAEAITPGIVVEGKRAIWQLGQVEVYDSGPNGTGYANCPPTCGNGDETTFLRQGVFVP